MGLKPTFKPVDIAKQLEQVNKVIGLKIVEYLAYLGEECTNHARSLDTYKNQTGNLRSSIGYVIIYNGKVLKSFFREASKDEKGQGVATAKAVASTLTSKAKKGYGLIVVAGMNYAMAVESKGYDVLTSAEHYAQKEIPKMRQQLKADIEKMRL